MDFLSLVIPVLIVATSYAACVRLAGWLLGRARVSWQHGYAYFGLVAGISLLVRLLGRSWPALPVPLALGLGLAAQILVGTWFFSTRATTAEGVPLGWRRALQLAALSSAFLLLVLALLLLIARSMGPIPTAP